MGVGRAPTTSSSRAKVKLRERVPRVAFAAILEDKLLQIFKHQYAALFMNLVDPVGFPDYYQKVQKPICLTDIRNKIGKNISTFSFALLLLEVTRHIITGLNTIALTHDQQPSSRYL